MLVLFYGQPSSSTPHSSIMMSLVACMSVIQIHLRIPHNQPFPPSSPHVSACIFLQDIHTQPPRAIHSAVALLEIDYPFDNRMSKNVLLHDPPSSIPQDTPLSFVTYGQCSKTPRHMLDPDVVTLTTSNLTDCESTFSEPRELSNGDEAFVCCTLLDRLGDKVLFRCPFWSRRSSFTPAPG